MSNILTTYSGRDVNFSLVSPISAPVQAAGINSTGVFQISVSMTVEQTVMETGLDGSVAVSAVPGDMGVVELQVWQTSTLQQQLLAWYNACKAARDQGDVSNWAGASILVESIVTGAKHIANSGVAPTKVPDTPYGTQSGKTVWRLMCANLINT